MSIYIKFSSQLIACSKMGKNSVISRNERQTPLVLLEDKLGIKVIGIQRRTDDLRSRNTSKLGTFHAK